MLIAANWKAYVEDFATAKKLVEVSKKLSKETKHQIILGTPAPFIGAFAHKNTSSVAFASQDVSASIGGAVTGEVTAAAVAAAGATYTLIGHSERRAMGDTDAVVAEKLARALAHNLIPILCVGEKERDDDGRYLATIREELTSALDALTSRERTQIIIAYEPLWAIGKTAADNVIGANDLAEMALYIRKVLAELLPGKSSAKTVVLYGGSVEPGNIRALAGGSGIDGFLIGHASANVAMFTTLVRNLS